MLGENIGRRRGTEDFVSTPFRHRLISLFGPALQREELGFGNANSYSCGLRDGYFDLEIRVLEPLENPFGPKVLPM
jgi:hypothetical protein